MEQWGKSGKARCRPDVVAQDWGFRVLRLWGLGIQWCEAVGSTVKVVYNIVAQGFRLQVS